MNRKIAFRAFHEPTKRYFDVDYYNEATVTPVSPDVLTDFELEHFLRQKYRRSDCIMLQHTSLEDKLGLDIWEGDILREDTHYDADQQARGDKDHSTYFKVVFEDAAFRVVALYDEDYRVFITDYCNVGETCIDMLRISNQFEHPELLELTKQEYPVAVPSPYNRSGGPQHVEAPPAAKVIPLHPNGLDFRVYHKPTNNFYVGITLHHEGVYVTNEERDMDQELPFDDCILLPFTGATDYTGRKIYEGDIYMHLSIDKETVDAAFVELVTNKACAYGFQSVQSGEFFPFCEPGMETDAAYYSYLGNRFENPGLLEVKSWETPKVFHAISEVMVDYNLPVMTQLHPFQPKQLKQYAVAFHKEHRSSTPGQQAA